MSSWAERVHRRAADLSSVVTSCGHPSNSAPGYPYRLEKVKFGVALEEVCKNNDNIPGPLLVLILKLNKESPNRRDVFRAPGHQGAMKKLIHFLQAGRLVNVDNYSVYTIASVLKKFLRKIPNGIFGRNGEKELFAIIELESEVEQTDRLHRLLATLPKYTQHLLVLLFGTFRVIASNAAHAGTGMTSEALGVSVAPSFFQSCVSDGKTARMEDVLKFKVATKIMKHIIDKFATHDLFGRDNYEYYARVTGRILKVQDEWICSFQYPPPPRGKLAQQKYALQHSLEAEKTWLQCQCERWGLLAQEESRSTPALLTSSSSALDNSVLSLGVSPEHSFIESCARLSVSLEGPGLFALTSSPIPKRGAEEEAQLCVGGIVLPDDDEENYADDDDDDDDDDFAAELDISNDDGADNNQRHNLPIRSKAAARNKTDDLAGAAAANNDDDDDDDEDEEVTIVKRRYRQNKKKTSTQGRMQQQHQRRMRVGSKSLDGVERAITFDMVSPGAVAVANASASAQAAKSKGAGGNLAAQQPTVKAAAKTRTCSRCNRGIRHSSSCSSASGGAAATANANPNGMTMEELRAVNRYAESTKSLSYLPQVHERQTARMLTRSEWFLGPTDGGALQIPNTCSDCCLAAQQDREHEKQHHQQQLPTSPHKYLGGGSTRDMRPQRNAFDVDDDEGNAFYMFYKKRQQQKIQRQQRKKQQQQKQQQQKQQQQQYLQVDNMDTDDSIDFEQPRIHSTRAFMLPKIMTAAAAAAVAARTVRAAASTSSAASTPAGHTYGKHGAAATTTTTTTSAAASPRLYKDTLSGSYVASNTNTTNTTKIITTTTTTTTTSNTTTNTTTISTNTYPNDITATTTTTRTTTMTNSTSTTNTPTVAVRTVDHGEKCAYNANNKKGNRLNNKYNSSHNNYHYSNSKKHNNNNINNNNNYYYNSNNFNFNSYTLSNRQHLTTNKIHKNSHNNNKNNNNKNTINKTKHKHNKNKRTSLYCVSNKNSSNSDYVLQPPATFHCTHNNTNDNSHYYSADSLLYGDAAAMDANDEQAAAYEAAAAMVTSTPTRACSSAQQHPTEHDKLYYTRSHRANFLSHNYMNTLTHTCATHSHSHSMPYNLNYNGDDNNYNNHTDTGADTDTDIDTGTDTGAGADTDTDTDTVTLANTNGDTNTLFNSHADTSPYTNTGLRLARALEEHAASAAHTQLAPMLLQHGGHNTNDAATASATLAGGEIPPNPATSDAAEEVDYVLTARFRHSTPMSQRRRLRPPPTRQRQAASSTATLRSARHSPTQSHYHHQHHHNHNNQHQHHHHHHHQPQPGHASGSRATSSGNPGNVGLSTSADSVQYPARYPPSVRRLIGINVPRQYPLRSSLRRNKEKHVGSINATTITTTTTTKTTKSTTNTINTTAAKTTKSTIITKNKSASNIAEGNGVSAVPKTNTIIKSRNVQMLLGCGGNQLPSVRNSIAECCISNSNNILTPTFLYNTIGGRSSASLDYRQHYSAYLDTDNDDNGTSCSNISMDITNAMKSKVASSSNALICTTATITTNPAVLSTTKLVKNLEHVAAAEQQQQIQQLQPTSHQQQQKQLGDVSASSAAVASASSTAVRTSTPGSAVSAMTLKASRVCEI